MKRIGELIGAAVFGGLAVAAVAFGVSRAQAQELSDSQAVEALVAEVEQAAPPPCAPQIDPELAQALRTATHAAIADTLGMTVEELEAALQSGQTVREIADDHGIEPEAIREAVEAARQPILDQAVADGTITQEQADRLLEHHPRPGTGPLADIAPEVRERIHAAVQAAIADALGITVEELEAAHEAGTLRELVEQSGIDPASLREVGETARLAAIDQAVADGLLTSEQAELLKSLPPRHGRGPHGPAGNPPTP